MNPLDIIILVILVIAFVVGVVKGIVRILFSLGGVIIGFILATQLYLPGARFAGNIIKNEKAAEILAFLVVFLGVIVVATILGWLITRAMKKVHLNWINRFAGGTLAVIAGLLFCGALIFMLTMVVSEDNSFMGKSVLMPYVQHLNSAVISLVPEDLKGRYEEAKNKLLDYGEKAVDKAKEIHEESRQKE
ncbi:CvpA family protein [bacterium]|nr:CvpA family protein [bacterium]